MGLTRPELWTTGRDGAEQGGSHREVPRFGSPSELLARAPAPLALQSTPLDIALVRATAADLFQRVDPTSAIGAAALSKRRLPHVYPRSILDVMDKRFAGVVHNRECVYIRGAQRRVGVTFFLTDYARAFNYRAATIRDPRRIAYVQLSSGLRSEAKFLDQLCTSIRTSLKTTELRFRATGTIVRRIIDTLRLYRVSVLILDHVQLLPPAPRAVIADLIQQASAEHATPLELDEYEGLHPRIGVVVAGHGAPERVFNAPGETLGYLLPSELVFPTYGTADDVADALRKSEIGLGDLDSSHFDDALLAQYVLELTEGRIDLISQLLPIIDLVARLNGAERPTLAIFAAAASFDQALRQRMLNRADPVPDRHGWGDVERRAQAYMAGEPVPLRARTVTERDESSAMANRGRKRLSPKEVHDGRDHAEGQRRQMTSIRRKRKRAG
ncbi:hypothetical protein [Longimicrobium sp.]|uniref:hypothetical protein n=1 Tax=Longimicrobium sp. TaxID=2029185 RepID=UPI002C2251E5|nr:hypothetical protein [Longimicrobium sp.]HSU13502.1 hypothetical protein [Longimicrobium sp.]